MPQKNKTASQKGTAAAGTKKRADTKKERVCPDDEQLPSNEEQSCAEGEQVRKDKVEPVVADEEQPRSHEGQSCTEGEQLCPDVQQACSDKDCPPPDQAASPAHTHADYVLEHDEVEAAELEDKQPVHEGWPSRIYDKPADKLSSKELGEEGERIAAAYLARRGYEIIETNWRCSFGEVDIVAKDGDTYVLVEVKSRLSLNKSADVMPELSVGRHKMNVYNRLALMYIAYHLSVETLRFDVIAINIISENCAKLRHLVGAFNWDNPC